MKKLIIHADDFGYARNFNRGILNGIAAGLVTSVSVLVNHPFTEPNSLKNFKGSISLHLEIPPDIASSEKLCQKTIQEQLGKFRKLFGGLPSHLDRHKASPCQKDEALAPILALAKKYKLPIRSMSGKDRQFLKKERIKTPNDFIFSYGPLKKEEVLEKLANLGDGVTEFMVHLGYFDPASRSSYNKPRETELAILLSPELKRILKEKEIILVNYKVFYGATSCHV